jgi:group I intron endonuclease
LIVYLAFNISSEKAYVGQTKFDLEHRCAQHFYFATHGSSFPFHRALRCSGDKFLWVILENVETQSELDELERHHIISHGAKAPKGYNCTDGGDGFRGKHSEETRRKMSLAHKGKKLGPHSADSILKMKASHQGKVTSEKTKQKLSIALSGRKVRQETCEKLSKLQRKQIAQCDLEGNVIKIFPSIKHAVLELTSQGHDDAHQIYRARHVRPVCGFLWKDVKCSSTPNKVE